MFTNDDPEMKNDFKRLKEDFIASKVSKNAGHSRIYARAKTVANCLGYSDEQMKEFRTSMCNKASALYDTVKKA